MYQASFPNQVSIRVVEIPMNRHNAKISVNVKHTTNVSAGSSYLNKSGFEDQIIMEFPLPGCWYVAISK